MDGWDAEATGAGTRPHQPQVRLMSLWAHEEDVRGTKEYLSLPKMSGLDPQLDEVLCSYVSLR